MALTDIICKNAKYLTKDERSSAAEYNNKHEKKIQWNNKLSDGKGLHLLIKPNGSRYWHLKYRFQGKEKLLSFGVYPELSLKEVRDKCTEARKLLSQGIDPSQAKQDKKHTNLLNAENSFETIAREWHEKQIAGWTEKHANYVLKRLEADVFPIIGAIPIDEIDAPKLLKMLQLIEKRGALDIAKRARQTSGQIFRYAIITGRATHDVSADLKGALKVGKVKHHPHLEESELPEFIQKVENYEILQDGNQQTKLALKFMLLTVVRTGELRGAKWSEIKFNNAEWHIPAERMKMNKKHIVPLSKQAIAILEELKKLNGHREHVFPNRNKPTGIMSENTMLYALYNMGYHSRLTVHGLRGTVSTLLNEHGFRADIIERQLAHSDKNGVRASYNHAEYLPERKKMMKWWADYIDKLANKKTNSKELNNER